MRGFYDGETKYARYYGIGGGVRRDGTVDEHGKLFDVDADFDDHDHEWYETAEDPHELVTWPTTEAAATSCARCSAVCWTMKQRS